MNFKVLMFSLSLSIGVAFGQDTKAPEGISYPFEFEEGDRVYNPSHFREVQRIDGRLQVADVPEGWGVMGRLNDVGLRPFISDDGKKFIPQPNIVFRVPLQTHVVSSIKFKEVEGEVEIVSRDDCVFPPYPPCYLEGDFVVVQKATRERRIERDTDGTVNEVRIEVPAGSIGKVIPWNRKDFTIGVVFADGSIVEFGMPWLTVGIGNTARGQYLDLVAPVGPNDPF